MVTQRVIISGGSGLIGQALVASLQRDGIETVQLVRRPASSASEVQWQPGVQPLDPEVLAGAQAVVNLNGASIGKLPWTSRYRNELCESRMVPTRTLAQTLRKLGAEAPLFVSASATGFYGSQPGVDLTEQSTAGASFLARLCVAWENEAKAAGPQARVALIRTASLLHPRAVLKPLILLTKLGVAGNIGRGTQVWPWISLEDEVRAIRHIIEHGITGPVNLAGPTPATATAIGRALAQEMHKPFWLTAPAWAMRLALGAETANDLLLSDARVIPKVLIDSGFTFGQPTAQAAIAYVMQNRG